MPDISTYNNLKLNYWAITKCGNTTVKHHLYTLQNGKTFDVKKSIHIHGRAGITYIKPEYALSNGFTNFTVTRHPYDRLLSMYKDLVLSRPKRGKKAGIEDVVTVDDLLEHIQSLPDKQRDVHFRSQSWFVPNKLDYIIDLKNISNWSLPIPSISFVKHKSKNTQNLLLSKHQKNKVYAIYKEDFVKFKYLK